MSGGYSQGQSLGSGSSNLSSVDAICWEKVTFKSFGEAAFIAEGGFGKVFKVKHKRTGQEFAMKMMAKSQNQEGNAETEYTMRERAILAYFERTGAWHPFIVRMFKAFQTETNLVLILQYCPGGNLRQLITRERKVTGAGLEDQLAAVYTVEILMALEHLHMQAIIHRDLKPENVVLDEYRHALLTDLGLAKAGVRHAHQARSFVGDNLHMAPEIILEEAHGRAVDIYGLGVLLYEMLAGNPPFVTKERTEIQEIHEAIVNEDLRFPDHFSPQVTDFLRAVMHRDPDQRLGAANSTCDIRWHPYLSFMPFDAIYWRAVPVPEPRSPEASKKSPEHVQHVKSAMAAAAIEDWATAETHAQRGVDCAPNDRTAVMAYYELVRAIDQQNRKEEATKALSIALGKYPEFEPLQKLEKIISGEESDKYPPVAGWSY